MKTLNQMLDGYKPKAGDEQKFKDKHVIVKSKLSKPTENEGQFAAPEVKVYKRAPTHGYDQGKDEEVYEAVDQTPPFKLSKSAFKKAKNPNRTPMDSVKALAQKGMKKQGVKEEVESIEEMKKTASGGRDNAGGQYYDIHNSDGTIGFGYKPGKSYPSSSHSNYEIKAEPKHPLHGKIVTAKHANGEQVTGRMMGTEHQGTVAKIKHSSGRIHHTDAKTVKKADSSMKEHTQSIEEMDKSQTPPGRDGGYQFAPGPKVSKKDIKAVNKDPVKHLSDLFAKHYTKKKQGVKEEVEQIDEKLTASDPTSTWIHDFVHSKNKKFAGKSREERIKMALGAKYAKEDFDFTEEELVLLEASDGAKNLYAQNHKESMDMLKKIGEGIKQHKANVMMNNNIHYGHVGTMKNIKRQLEDLHQQVTQEGEYAQPMRIGEEVEEEQQAPLFERTSSLNKLIEAAYKKQPVGVKIHYTHPEKKATWAQHFSASDAASGEKEMAAQGYKVKKRELIYGKVGA